MSTWLVVIAFNLVYHVDRVGLTVSLICKSARAKILLKLCSDNCGIVLTRFHAFNYGFYVVEEKRFVTIFLKFLYVDMCEDYTSQSRLGFDWYNLHL